MFAREGGFSSSRRVKADASSATTETSAPGDFLPVGWVFKSVRRVLDFGLRARARGARARGFDFTLSSRNFPSAHEREGGGPSLPFFVIIIMTNDVDACVHYFEHTQIGKKI